MQCVSKMKFTNLRDLLNFLVRQEYFLRFDLTLNLCIYNHNYKILIEK